MPQLTTLKMSPLVTMVLIVTNEDQISLKVFDGDLKNRTSMKSRQCYDKNVADDDIIKRLRKVCGQ